MTNKDIWQKINLFPLDQEGVSFSFTKRLARDNNWKDSFAERVVDEYRKFIYLCYISEHPITPSDSVDQAWHLHLTYTKSYWNDLCLKTLGKEIHHNPTEGGNIERQKFSRYYSQTFDIYQREFCIKPPADIWLNSKERFTQINYSRINLHRYWLIEKPKGYVKHSILILFLISMSLILFIRADDSSGFIAFMIIVAVIAVLVRALSGKDGGSRGGGCAYDSGCSGCSGCGGCGGCGD